MNVRWSILLLMLLASPLAGAQDKPSVVVTFSVIEDLTAQVAGDLAQVRSLTPRGAEVHEYELRSRDFQALEDADLVLYNGLNLELWMGQVRTVVGAEVPVVALAESETIEPLPIIAGEFGGDPDPHVWMDPRRVVEMVNEIERQLIELLPDQADVLRANADAFRDDLDVLYRELREAFQNLPASRRVLISSEAAFVYFAEAFDFFHDAIWGSNAEVEGSPRQIMRITDVIAEREPAALFWESTVSSRQIEGIASDTGVPVRGPLYVDSLGPADGDAGTYQRMMRKNMRILKEALGDGR